MAFFELRQYQVKLENMDVWVEFMEREIIPFVNSKGMIVKASFRGEEDQSLYFWIRRFENEAEQKALYEVVYESEFWKNSLSPKGGLLINRDASIVQGVVATNLSAIQ